MSAPAPDDNLFTSQLSVDGFALCEPAGIVPIRQVMGSCVFQVGSPSYYASARLSLHHGQVRGAELTAVSEGFTQAREQALGRMRSEALVCGAHAVVDIRVRREHWDSLQQSVEYIISGTAVRFGDGRHPPPEPALIALPVEDCWKLMQANYESVGIAAASVVYETAPSVDATRALSGMRYTEGRATREIPEFSDTVSGVIGMALARAGESAARRHAQHIVGVRVEHKLEAIERANTGRIPLTREPSKRKDLRVTVHLLGTAIRDLDKNRGRERTEWGTWRELDRSSSARGAATKNVVRLNRADRPGRPSAGVPPVDRAEIEKGKLDATSTARRNRPTAAAPPND